MCSDLARNLPSVLGGGSVQSRYALARAYRRQAQRRRSHRISGWERFRMLLVPKHLDGVASDPFDAESVVAGADSLRS